MQSFNLLRGSISLSVFVKCILILSAATAIVAGVIAVSSDRAIRSTAGDGLRELASSVTSFQATGLTGAVRFRRTDDIEALLGDFLSTESERVLGTVVIGADGEVLSLIGDLTDEQQAQLSDLAETSIATGESGHTADGFWRSSPIGARDAPIAALAIAWSPIQTFARLDAERSRQMLLAGGVFLVLTIASGLFFRQALAVPLRRLARRTTEMAEGDLDSPVPNTKKTDEIGKTAQQLEFLREKLYEADLATRDARFQSAGFENASVPLVMTDTAYVVTHANGAFQTLLEKSLEIRELLEIADANALIGSEMSPRDIDETAFAGMTSAGLPFSTDLFYGGRTFHVSLNTVLDSNGDVTGYVMEWDDVSQARITAAVLDALEAAQLRADFNENGLLTNINKSVEEASSELSSKIGFAKLNEVLGLASGGDLTETLKHGTSVYDQFELSNGVIASGILAPIKNAGDQVTGFVFLGNDITASENAKKSAENTRKAMEEEQELVVAALSSGLSALSNGNLTTRLTDDFPRNHESLREHFNSSIGSMESAVAVVRDNSANILGEADNISRAADDLSKRTEQQAATLEEFAASLTELTASVAATAEGANQANDVVKSARDNAESSGSVVREAVDAMGEISESSDRISRIISVIDDIAFQTNLLALNAGVEAARAGDAGRGFAVVASEVRALAQRSSEAASEINELISSSSTQVKKGVSLVGKAGEALETIVASIGGIADHVNSIAASAKEQSTGIEEINIAMSQLDQATQQNVAMFEETTAATHTLRTEASTLVEAAHRFTVSTGSGKNSKPTSAENAHSHSPRSVNFAKPVNASLGRNAAVQVAQNTLLNDDWEDF